MTNINGGSISRGLYRDVQAARNARRDEGKTWGSFSVRKDGRLYAKPNSIWTTEEEALDEGRRMAGLNPGKTFTAAKIG